MALLNEDQLSRTDHPLYYNGLQALARLFQAEDPATLARALSEQPQWGSRVDHWTAVWLFRHLHAERSEGVVGKAVLLCTDQCWDRCTARLIAGIEETGILSIDELDEMAECFVFSDTIDYLHASGSSAIELSSAEGSDAEDDAPEWPNEVGPVTMRTRRVVRPPLRRWGAARMLRSNPQALSDVLGRIDELDGYSAGAVVAGALDAIDALDEPEARCALKLGLGWPQGSVRLKALNVLVERGDAEWARRRAACDPDAKIRSWRPRRRSLPAPERSADSSGRLIDRSADSLRLF